MTDSVVQGNAPRFRVTFTDENGDVVDPDDVVFLVERPGGEVLRYVYLENAELVKESTGIYHVDYVLSVGDLWYWRWEGDGDTKAAAQDKIYVIPARPAYA